MNDKNMTDRKIGKGFSPLLFNHLSVCHFSVMKLILLAHFLAVAAAAKPNIVLILADDLGWKDVGYQGTDYYETPNLDRLSKQGMVFRAAYSPVANCQGSRACLMSGQYTPRHLLFANGSSHQGVEEDQEEG